MFRVNLQAIIIYFAAAYIKFNASNEIGTNSHYECPVESKADIDTVNTFPRLNFTPHVLPSTVALWNNALENRYQLLKSDKTRPELKVFIVPHSHNDPGWLQTFEEYFDTKTKFIINNIVNKLTEFSNMTFVWNEISFLEKWWSHAKPAEKKALKKLIKQGRLEITTGGWVMPDEACTHIYSLLDQYIEGHEWLRINLEVAPKTGWSIDPFGHGPTVPYLLDQSGIKGTIIQRLHYAWKQWFAETKSEDFYWITGWSKKNPSLLVHNMPLEIYSVQGSCGPHPLVCEEFNFKPNSYKFIDERNVELKANTLMNEYQRLGSLTEHNVILIQLGEDFSYQNALEFDKKFLNYQVLFKYVNERKHIYNARLQFGTPQDYFKEIKKNIGQKEIVSFPTLKGDFFPYSDMFTSGRAQYWTGFYTTNPYMKIIARELEHQLRTSEILFSLIYNRMNCTERTSKMTNNILKFYQYLVLARRNLGLFQHHDGMTGTSKARVMMDYGNKLFRSLRECLELQEAVLSMEMMKDSQRSLKSKKWYKDYGQTLMEGILINLVPGRGVVVFNSLNEDREVVVDILTNKPNVQVMDNFRRRLVKHEINPVIYFNKGTPNVSGQKFNVAFVAELPALSAITYTVRINNNKNTAHAKVYSDNNIFNRGKKHFKVLQLPPGDIILENSVYNLTLDRQTGFLKEVYRKDKGVKHVLNIEIGAYNSYSMESGAYLFKPHPKKPTRVLSLTDPDAIIVKVGQITTDIITFYLPYLVHRVKIIHSNNLALSRGILIKNFVYFDTNVTDTELFMRFHTDIKSKKEFYTDQNGFQYQKRVRVKKLGIEGNYYPINTMAWIQDKKTRLTYITDHAQGASSFKSGRLEVMLQRITKYDDGRGLGEGISDDKPIKLSSYLVFDSIVPGRENDNLHELPSIVANQLSRNINYPVNVYFSLNQDLSNLNSYVRFATCPADLHLMSLRTITENDLPSHSFYMVLHRPGYSCRTGFYERNFTNSYEFNLDQLQISNITAVSLTGLEDYSKISKLENIKLDPMELKTFRINLASNSKCT